MGLNIEEAVRHLHARGFPKRLLQKYIGNDPFELIENKNENFLKAKDKCKRYSEQFSELPLGTGLVLIGAPGSGKSLLACVTVLEIFKRQAVSVRMTDVDGVIIATNRQWTPQKGEQAPDLYSPSILVIDDFPKTSHLSRDVADVVNRVYRKRYDKGKTTIITASCDSLSVAEKFTPSFLSFIQESAILIKDLEESNDYRKNVRPKLK